MVDGSKRKKRQLESLENGRGVEYILNEAFKILGNPIALFDTSYNLLLYTEGIVTDDPLWNELITLGGFSLETVDFFNRENFIDKVANADITAYLKSNKLKYDRINGKLFDKDNIQLANIIVVACCNKFEEDDQLLIKAICEIISKELRQSEYYQKIDRVYQEYLLNKLIDGEIPANKIAKAQIAQFYGELKTNFYLAVVDISQYEHTVTHLAYFRDLFKKIQPEYRYYIHLNYIVIFISTDNAILRIKSCFGKLYDFFTKYKIFAGISSGFQDLRKLRKYYREAINALNYGLKGLRAEQVFRYDNIRVECFLNSVKNITDISKIYSPVIFSILDYDRENNTSLLKLFYTYLLYGKDTDLTCEKLEITRDSLDVQLMELEEIFDIDWKNGDMLFNIFVSIKMLEDFPH